SVGRNCHLDRYGIATSVVRSSSLLDYCDLTVTATPHDPIASYLRHLEVERRVAANTLEAYRRDLSRLTAFAKESKRDLTALTRADLEAFVRVSMRSGLSPTSTGRLVASVRGLYKFLRLSGAIAHNPADDLHAPRAFAGLPRSLSLDDVDRLLAAP